MGVKLEFRLVGQELSVGNHGVGGQRPLSGRERGSATGSVDSNGQTSVDHGGRTVVDENRAIRQTLADAGIGPLTGLGFRLVTLPAPITAIRMILLLSTPTLSLISGESA